MATSISASTVIILCLWADVTTLVPPLKFTNTAVKSKRSDRLEYQLTRIRTGDMHQQTEKNPQKLKPHIYTANSKNDNLNPAANLSFETPNRTIFGQRDSYILDPRDISVSQPISLQRKGLSLQTGITDSSTFNKSTIKSRMNTESVLMGNNRAISSTDRKYAIEERINTNHDERVNKHLRLERQAAYNNPLVSEHITSLVTQIPNYPKRHDSNVNEGSIGEYRRCDCDNTRCVCSNRGLTLVPQDLPSKTRELFLNENKIETLPTNIFSRYVFLESLSLENNRILIIEEGAFNGLTLLTSLDLSGNRIGDNNNISDLIFQPLSSVKSLQLHKNDYPCDTSTPYPDRYLAYLHNLEELYIDNYGNKDFGPGFRNMTSLRNVTVFCYCPLSSERNTLFDNLKHIEQLYIHDCRINGKSVAPDLFSPLTKLTTLDISRNKRIEMEYLPLVMQSVKNARLQTLIMDIIAYEYSLNIITSSVTRCFPQTLTTLIARDNNIISVEPDAVQWLPKSIKFIDLSDNYIIVNPIIFSLRELLFLEVLLLNSESDECFIEFNDVSAKSSWNKKRKYKHALNNKSKLETQLLISGLPPNLKQLQINIKTYNWYIYEKNNIEELDLRCSLLPEVDFDFLQHFPNLRILNLGRSSIQRIYGSPFSTSPIEVLILESNKLYNFLSKYGFHFMGLDYLSHLDLSFNQLNSLHRDLLGGLDNLEFLRLDNNKFSHFDVNISHMEQLKLLNLSNTELPNLPLEVRSQLDHLCQARPAPITVDMSGCPIQCDCFNLEFLKWMVRSPAFDKNFTGYKCRSSDTSLKDIVDGYTEIIHDLNRECAQNYPVFVLILAVTLILLCAVTGTIIYR